MSEPYPNPTAPIIPQEQATEEFFMLRRNDRMEDTARAAARAAHNRQPHTPRENQHGGTGPSYSNNAWRDPQPLDDALPSVEPFVPEMLPDSVRAFVIDVAERMQAPVEYVAVTVMVGLGAALGRKIAIRPKQLDDWYEFANLWAACIGPPSWMKSPAIGAATEPLRRIEAAELEQFEFVHRQWEAENAAAEVKMYATKQKARKAAAQGKSFDRDELIADSMPEEPQPPRLIVNDATVPALCEVLRGNPDGVLVHRDELSGLIAELDREGMEGSRAFYLTGWSGKESYVQDRIIRGSNIRVPHVCLSMLGGIQPSKVAPLLRESLATGGADGFVARFSMLVWPDHPGEYRALDRRPDEGARASAQQVFERLRHLRPVDVYAEMEDGAPPFVRMEPAAAEAFTTWDVEMRNRCRQGGEDAAVAAHLGKYPKLVCALALLIHLAEGNSGAVTVRAVERALAWAEFLESHARRVYASLGQAHVDAARSLLRRLRKGELASPFRLRDVQRRGWAHLQDRESVQAAADVLEARGHLRRREVPTGDGGGRPTVEYHVNPKALMPEGSR